MKEGEGEEGRTTLYRTYWAQKLVCGAGVSHWQAGKLNGYFEWALFPVLGLIKPTCLSENSRGCSPPKKRSNANPTEPHNFQVSLLSRGRRKEKGPKNGRWLMSKRSLVRRSVKSEDMKEEGSKLTFKEISMSPFELHDRAYSMKFGAQNWKGAISLFVNLSSARNSSWLTAHPHPFHSVPPSLGLGLCTSKAARQKMPALYPSLSLSLCTVPLFNRMTIEKGNSLKWLRPANKLEGIQVCQSWVGTAALKRNQMARSINLGRD